MFVQITEGRVSDRDRLHRRLDNWQSELRPGAQGFLGSAAGVTDDGHAIAFARFESAEAKANSDRPEQGARTRRRSRLASSPATWASSRR